MNDLSEIEIEHNCYCAENGYFCPYLDKNSRVCIATTCRHAQDLLFQAESHRQLIASQKTVNEICESVIEQAEKYGAAFIDLGISEEDLP